MKRTTITLTIDTKQGPASVQVIDHGPHWQYNCFMPPSGGAGIFALLPAALSEAECRDTMRELIEAGPHAEEQDITHLSEKLVAAGTVNMLQINLSKLLRESGS